MGNGEDNKISYSFEDLQKDLKSLGTGLDYDNKEVNQKLYKYINTNINDAVEIYIDDVKCSLNKNGFFTHSNNYYKVFFNVFNQISKNELKYYKKKLEGFKDIIFLNKNTLENLNNVIKNDPKTEKNTKEHIIRLHKAYLVKQGILKPKPNIMFRVINKMKSEMKGLVSKLKVTERYKPVVITGAGLSAIAGIGGISYAIGKENAIKNMTKDIKDHMHTHMSLFGVLVILCSVAATLALCMVVAYHIKKKKKQPNITYSVIDLM